MAISIALVQSTKKVVNTVNNTTLAYGSNVTAASVLIVSMATWQGASDEFITTPTDTLGNTYAPITVEQNAGAFNSLCSFYALNSPGGANTVSFDINGLGSGDITVTIAEFSGLATASALDKTNVSNGTSTTASGGATGTLSQADELIYAAMAHTGNNATLTEDTADSFNLLQENEGGTSNMPIAVQYKIVSATTDTTPNWAIQTSRTWIGHVGTFKAAGGAASGATLRRRNPMVALIGR